MSTELIPITKLSTILSAREAALATMRQAVELMVQGRQLAAEAQHYAEAAHGLDRFYEVDRSKLEDYRRLFLDVVPERTLEVYRQAVDASAWMHILRTTGMESMMDRTAKDSLYADLRTQVPELTEDNVRATLESLAVDAKLIFQRGLARVFSSLDRRFRSHDAFKIGARIILTYAFDEWGHMNSRLHDTLIDMERVFAVLDGKPGGSYTALHMAIRESRQRGLNRHQSSAETAYFRANAFKNGNLHLWFANDELVVKANQVLAEYYGEVLPDAAPIDADPMRDKRETTAISKDLAYYPSPLKVVQAILQASSTIDGSSYVLEPSAGTGSIVRAALETGANVCAVEVDPGRAAALSAIRHPRLNVLPGNFLAMEPEPVFTHVLMNPPFYGTHWMAHVMRAWEWLAPGGSLVSVLPVMAEVGNSAQHVAFRAWVQKVRHRSYGPLFSDLPEESFASSGTRINTVILSLTKR